MKFDQMRFEYGDKTVQVSIKKMLLAIGGFFLFAIVIGTILGIRAALVP